MTDSNRLNGRDEKGRFAKGNPGGPGNPQIRKQAVYRQAIREAVTEVDFAKIVAVLIKKAQDGDVTAARVILNRTLGRSTPAREDEATTFELPPITQVEDLSLAGQVIMRALASGEISATQATVFSALLEQTRKSMETIDLVQRIEQLEKLDK